EPPETVVLLPAERSVEPRHDLPPKVLKRMPRLLVEPDVVADDLEPCEVDVVQVQQHGVGQVFFTHSLPSEAPVLGMHDRKPSPDFRLPCNLARWFILYLLSFQRFVLS